MMVALLKRPGSNEVSNILYRDADSFSRGISEEVIFEFVS